MYYLTCHLSKYTVTIVKVLLKFFSRLTEKKNESFQKPINPTSLCPSNMLQCIVLVWLFIQQQCVSLYSVSAPPYTTSAEKKPLKTFISLVFQELFFILLCIIIYSSYEKFNTSHFILFYSYSFWNKSPKHRTSAGKTICSAGFF